MTALAPCRTMASVMPRQMPLPPPEQSKTRPAKIFFWKMSVVGTASIVKRRGKRTTLSDTRMESGTYARH